MKIYFTFIIVILLLFIPTLSSASYFAPPYPTGTSWDTVFGFITHGGSSFGNTGDEIAGYDASGTIRMWFQLSSDGQFGFVSFFDPSPDSYDTSTFTFKFYQTSTMSEYSLTADFSNWGTWQGGGGPYRVDMTRGDDPVRVVPEPSTFIILAAVAGLGLLGLKKKKFQFSKD